MAKTNTKASTNARTTYEGTPAKQLTLLQQLKRAALSCMLWEDQFYESGVSIAERISDLTLKVEPHDAAEVAKMARNDFKLRHAPLWIVRALANGNKWQRQKVADALYEVIQRPDELTEFMALYWKNGKTPIASGVKRGLARAFTKFNAHTLAKYNRTDEAIKLRDVLFLCHAKPKDAEQGTAFKQLIEGTLPTPDTWETKLSAGADAKETFTRLITENKLGALAMLRNLRNMIEAKVAPEVIIHGLETMKTERVLPFRFITAAKYAPQFEAFIENAMMRCLHGMPKLKGRTALVIDTSPSMWHANVSAKSEMSRFDAAAALAMLCREICEEVNVYAFNSKAYRVPARHGFALHDSLAKTMDNWSCGGLAVQMANDDGYDRIIVLTDGEWHYSDTDFREGDAAVVAPAPLTEKAYLINIASYQNAIGSGKWNMIDGWSEAIIDYIQAIESENLVVA